jgi:hypothetical protein
MKSRIFYILFLLFTLNLFSQDFKDEYLRVSAEEPIRKNQYTVKSIHQDVNYIWIKRFMGNKTEVLTFEKCLSGLDLVKVENYKNELLDGFYLETDNHSFVRKGYYKKGKRNGYWQIKEEEKVSKGHYKNDKKIGLWEERVFSNVAKGKYKHGKKHGLWTIEDIDLKIINEKGEEERVIDKVYYKNGVEVKK